MRLLLTSRGIVNASIRSALVDLLGKPIAEASAVIVPTALHAMPRGGRYLWEELDEQRKLGWREMSILELAATTSLLEEHWLPALREADAIFVSGGNTPYLSYWFERSGFAKLLPVLLERSVYVGVSAGSMVVTHSTGIRLLENGVYADEPYGDVAPPHAGSDFTAKLVGFTMRPHYNAPDFERITRQEMEATAADAGVPLYAIDDQTAIKIVDDSIEVVSEGDWILFEKGRANAHSIRLS